MNALMDNDPDDPDMNFSDPQCRSNKAPTKPANALAQGQGGASFPVTWEGAIDTRYGRRAIVQHSDGTHALVLISNIKMLSGQSSPKQPTCDAPSCLKPIDTGLCPKHGTRKYACCHAHYLRAKAAGTISRKKDAHTGVASHVTTCKSGSLRACAKAF